MSNDNLELSAKISSQIDFQNELRVLVEFARAILLKQKGVPHELQVVFEEKGILNIEDTEE